MSFRSGQRVIHQDRPEWGVGVVLSAQGSMDGAQRLRIRFERTGLKMLSVPPAAVLLQPVPTHEAQNHTNGAKSQLDGLSDEDACRRMIELPEATRDPFSSLQTRLTQTLNLFRFTLSPASLIDWAAIQSGLADPLTRFTRQKLEQLFPQFERKRDEHLRSLLSEARQQPAENLELVVKHAPPAGQRAMSRFIKV